MKRRKILTAISLILFAAGTGLLGGQAWLYAKAQVAKVLISRSFSEYLKAGKPCPPWSWADLHPIARMEVPRLAVERFVLSGASGSSMAFGPGHMDGTALPGEKGNCVLSGHRDTWFAFLEDLEPGDELRLQALSGIRTFSVRSIRIVSVNDRSVFLKICLAP